MQMRPGQRLVFSSTQSDADILLAVHTAGDIPLVLMEAIQELMSRSPEKHRNLCLKLVALYKRARLEEVEFEVEELEGMISGVDEPPPPEGHTDEWEEVERIRSLFRRPPRIDTSLAERLFESDFSEAVLQSCSPLALFGYNVRRDNGLTVRQRREFLEDFLKLAPIPKFYREGYRKGWGRPDTEDRRTRMLNHIGGRIAMAGHQERMAAAVAQWEGDMAWVGQVPVVARSR